jgi:hypothetical protein
MSTPTEQTTELAPEEIVSADAEPEQELEQTIALELPLNEAEALRAWLLKPAGDGMTSLDDPLVSRALTKLGAEIDGLLATVNVRNELQLAGFEVEHLSDEQVRDIGRRVTKAATPGFRP